MKIPQDLYAEITRKDKTLNDLMDEIPCSGLTRDNQPELESTIHGLDDALAALARLVNRFKTWTPPESS